MKEYRKINDLGSDLKKEIGENESFFNDFDGKSLDEQQRVACVLNDCDLEIIAGAGFSGQIITVNGVDIGVDLSGNIISIDWNNEDTLEDFKNARRYGEVKVVCLSK